MNNEFIFYVFTLFFDLFLFSLLQLHIIYNKKCSNSFWKNGVFIKDSKGNSALAELSGNTITLSIFSRGGSERLLRDCISIIHLLIRNWFPVEVKQSVVCVHCIGNQFRKLSSLLSEPNQNNQPYQFTIDELEVAAATGKPSVLCRDTIPVKLTLIIPEMLMVDKQEIPYSEVISRKECGKGAYGTVYEVK